MSLYKELYGSNNWNGTAVAFILLMGAIGAITPVALGVDRPNPLGSIKSTCQRKGRYLPLNNNSTDRTNIDIVKNNIDVHNMEDVENDLTFDTTSESESKTGNSCLLQSNLQSRESINQSIAECEINRNKDIYSLSADTSLFLLISGAISIVSLILFLVTWSVMPSIGMLGLFFASWQCISAIILTQLAQYLTTVTVTLTNYNQIHSIKQQESKSWGGAENIIVEDVTHNQLNPFYSKIMKCQESDFHNNSDIQIKSHINIYDNDDDNNDNINVHIVGVRGVGGNIISSSLSLCKEIYKDGIKDEMIVTNSGNGHNNMTEVTDVCIKNCEKKINLHTKNELLKKNSFSSDKCKDDDYPTSRGIHTVLESDGTLGPESINNGMTEDLRKTNEMDSERNRNSMMFELKGDFDDNNENENKNEDEDDKDEYKDGDKDRDDGGIRCRKEEGEEDAMITSPFSLAIVAIVGMSVLLQGFLQGMFFTYFGLPLRLAFSILLIIYVLSTLLFVLGCVARVRGQECFNKSYLSITSMIFMPPSDDDDDEIDAL